MKRRARLALCAFLTGPLCACASHQPTLELYQQVQAVRLYGFTCTPGTTERLDRRVERLHPWLYSTLGHDQVAAMDSNLEQERGLVDLVRCPTVEERGRSLRAYGSFVRELERRSRRVPADQSPPDRPQ